MKYYLITWRWMGKKSQGFVRADNIEEAWQIARERLKPDALILRVNPAHENMITPQSLTINFTNTTDYHLF